MTIDIYKDRNNNYYVQAGDYKVRIADGTKHDGTTIGHFELVKKLTIPAVVGRSEQLPCGKCENGLIWSKDRLKAKSCDCGK